MELQDEIVHLDDITKIEDDSIFKLEKLASYSYEKDSIVQMDITIEMNLDQGFIERTGYNILDVLSDIGGIWATLLYGLGTLLGFWNYKHFDNFMASKLFKIQKKKSE